VEVNDEVVILLRHAQGVADMDDLRPEDPQWIGTYRLEKRLGGGGMGLVYLGRSPGGRLVAIKVIRAELASDPEFRTRFAREVTAARKVSGIVTAEVVDADLHGPVPWLATSYVAGPSLEQEVSGHGPLPAAAVTALAAGLAEGLNVIHAAGVVHRDLKPSNVLLAADGPRLIDFGISQSAEMSRLTSTGMVIGSPGFISPEQATGRETGPPSDIFSLGAVLVFAATGRGPVRHRIQRGPARPGGPRPAGHRRASRRHQGPGRALPGQGSATAADGSRAAGRAEPGPPRGEPRSRSQHSPPSRHRPRPRPGPGLRVPGRPGCLRGRDQREAGIHEYLEPPGSPLRAAGLFERGFLTHRTNPARAEPAHPPAGRRRPAGPRQQP
jgi:serine/threonine protein kinase